MFERVEADSFGERTLGLEPIRHSIVLQKSMSDTRLTPDQIRNISLFHFRPLVPAPYPPNLSPTPLSRSTSRCHGPKPDSSFIYDFRYGSLVSRGNVSLGHAHIHVFNITLEIRSRTWSFNPTRCAADVC